MTALPFVFATAMSQVAHRDDFTLAVHRDIQTIDSLLSCYAEQGRFPDYFGRNWDALLDCLRDFSWIEQRRIVVVHGDLPLANHREDLRAYLEILETAAKDWSEPREGPFVEPPDNWRFIEHELVVVFPSALERDIRNALAR